MLTFFTIPKPQTGYIAHLQANALANWRFLHPTAEIFVCGAEDGLDALANDVHARRVETLAANSWNTPLVSDAFARVKKEAQGDVLVYVNADILFLHAFDTIMSTVSTLPAFLIVGRRIDLTIDEVLKFDESFGKNMQEKIQRKGALHGPSGLDYFIFPKNFPITMPAFAVGRSGWDNWLVFETRRKKIPVIDATAVITAIHQNHDYSHHTEGKQGTHASKEAQENWKNAGGLGKLMNITGANMILTQNGLRIAPFKNRLYAWLILFPITQRVIALMRSVKLKSHLKHTILNSKHEIRNPK